MESGNTRDLKLAALGESPFRLESVTAVDAPEGVPGDNWHRYVITQGANEIVGHRQGSKTAVRQAVEAIVESLNLRRVGKPGRVHLTSNTRATS